MEVKNKINKVQNVIEIIHRGIHQAFTNVYPSIITLNVNELNSPIKTSYWMDFFLKMQIICCWQETHFSFKNTHRFNIKECKKMFHASIKQKKAG